MAELAMVLPLLILFIFVIIQAGLLISHYNTLSNMAREGARWGLVRPGQIGGSGNCASPLNNPSPASVLQAACSFGVGLDPAGPIEVIPDLLDSGEDGCRGPFGCVRVIVKYTDDLFFAPFIPGASVPLGSKAVMALEVPPP
jgi:hypothetical protein